jgi:hypothetical protein
MSPKDKKATATKATNDPSPLARRTPIPARSPCDVTTELQKNRTLFDQAKVVCGACVLVFWVGGPGLYVLAPFSLFSCKVLL